jgi:adenosylhomocysteine nucleosidase
MGNRCFRSIVARALVSLLLLPGAAVAAAGESGPVVLLGAMDAEAQPLLGALSDRGALPVLGIPCLAGTLSGRRAVVAVTGVGKVNAAMTTALLLERFSPAAVIFTGVAGGLDPDLQPGDVVIGERLVQHDLVRYTEQGRLPRTVRNPVNRSENPIVLESSRALLALARDAASRLALERLADEPRPPRVLFGTIATGDSFVASSAKKTELRSELGAHAVEMEGAAVAQVCHQHGVPFLVVRGLSDRAAGDAPAEARRNLGVAARNAAAVALDVARHLGP